MSDYQGFLSRKSQLAGNAGFEPLWLPDFLKPFQRHLDDWAIRRGRGAIFAGCGLGKSPMYFVWAENVVRHTNRPVLVATTLGDSGSAIKEAGKFGVEAVRSRDGRFQSRARVIVTNYERLHYFDPRDFAGVVANESSILKNFKGKTKTAVTEFLRTIPYRLLATATPSPNDYIELGTSSEALGELGHRDMLTRFFVKQQLAGRNTVGWGREQYRMKGWAEADFWRWVCSWARALRTPADLGFDDSEYRLPSLECRQHVAKTAKPRAGLLFDLPAINLEEQREELRRTLTERCEKAAELVTAHDNPAVAWCYLNDEGDLLEKLIPGAVQISGSDSDDAKEEAIEAFTAGQITRLVTKPKLTGFGQNWQHCAHMTFFPSHSWEQWHQTVRRCWRFGQTKPVTVDVIATEGMADVLDNLQRKERKVDRMFARMVALVNQAMGIRRAESAGIEMEAPAWLS